TPAPTRPTGAKTFGVSGNDAGNDLHYITFPHCYRPSRDPHSFPTRRSSDLTINSVKLSWEAAYGKAYSIDVSADGTSWTTIYSTTGRAHVLTPLRNRSRIRRSIWINITVRGTIYAYSRFDVPFYGSDGASRS